MPMQLFAQEASLQKRTKKAILAEKILDMIFTGLLLDGDELPSERELANIFGVSRETVRGSLGVLSDLELIHVSQGAKTRINRTPELLERCKIQLPELANMVVNNHDIDSVFETRRIIEQALVRKAAITIDSDGLKTLSNLLDQQATMFKQPIHFQLSDKQFHRTIAECVPNELLNRYAEELYSYALNFRRVAMSVEGSIKQSFLEHKRIYDALENRDPDLAEQMITQHINSVYETTLMVMRKRSGLARNL